MTKISNDIENLNRQLYPTGRVWNYVRGPKQVNTEVIRFVDGLGNPFVDGLGNQFIQTISTDASESKLITTAFLQSFVRFYEDLMSILNEIIADNGDFDETDSSNWERIYGLISTSLTLEERKANILRRQSYPAGLEERCNAAFIQAQLQAIGFDVYVIENRFWDSDLQEWYTIDPDDAVSEGVQLNNAYLGVSTLGGTTVETNYTICANHIEEDVDSEFFGETSPDNQLGIAELGDTYLSNYSPGDPDEYLKSTFFIGGSTLGEFANISEERKKEFRQTILKLKPAQTVAFLYINYI